jgi:hypothetical protein
MGIIKENFSHGFFQGIISTLLFIFLYVVFWHMGKGSE